MDPAEDILNALDDSTISGDDTTGTGNTSPESRRNVGKKSGWRGLSAFKAQASMQDKLLEK